jgi:hypothetical protein
MRSTTATNVLTGDSAARLLSRFAASNRVADPLRQKSYASGYVWLCTGGKRASGLAYFPREQILSFQNYEFSFRDTNDIASLFR